METIHRHLLCVIACRMYEHLSKNILSCNMLYLNETAVYPLQLNICIWLDLTNCSTISFYRYLLAISSTRCRFPNSCLALVPFANDGEKRSTFPFNTSTALSYKHTHTRANEMCLCIILFRFIATHAHMHEQNKLSPLLIIILIVFGWSWNFCVFGATIAFMVTDVLLQINYTNPTVLHRFFFDILILRVYI